MPRGSTLPNTLPEERHVHAVADQGKPRRPREVWMLVAAAARTGLRCIAPTTVRPAIALITGLLSLNRIATFSPYNLKSPGSSPPFLGRRRNRGQAPLSAAVPARLFGTSAPHRALDFHRLGSTFVRTQQTTQAFRGFRSWHLQPCLQLRSSPALRAAAHACATHKIGGGRYRRRRRRYP